MIFRNLRNVNNTKCATYDIIFICFEDEGEKMRGKEINKPMLEICCGSFSDVKTAYENGADRVELNSALYMGGLTPTLANLIYAKEKCNIPVVAMVRPRGGAGLVCPPAAGNRRAALPFKGQRRARSAVHRRRHRPAGDLRRPLHPPSARKRRLSPAAGRFCSRRGGIAAAAGGLWAVNP